MKRLVLCCASLVVSGFLYSQQFAYSFNGTLSVAQQDKIKSSILALPDVSSCELKIKTDKQAGEFFFYVEPKTERSESSTEFSPVAIKTLFIENNLEPLSFRQIK